VYTFIVLAVVIIIIGIAAVYVNWIYSPKKETCVTCGRKYYSSAMSDSKKGRVCYVCELSTSITGLADKYWKEE